MIDLTKLTPWRIGVNPNFVRDENGNTIAQFLRRADAEACVLQAAAADVQRRRGWHPTPYPEPSKLWYADFPRDDHEIWSAWMSTHGGYSDPEIALIEADQWMSAREQNVENQP